MPAHLVGMADLAIVASTSGLAHTAWLSLRRRSPHVILLGEPGYLGGASRMPLTCLSDPTRAELQDAVGDRLVFPAGERAHVLALEAGLPCVGHPEPDLLRRLGDKRRYPELGRRYGFPTPPVVDAADRGTWLEKPRWGFGAVGVRPWRAGMQRRRDTILQPVVDGPDVDVSLLAIDGEVRAITTERPLGSMRAYTRDKKAEAAATQLVEGTGYTGLLHLDMRSGPTIIDINPRIWATHWMAAAMGMDFVQAYMDAVSGRPIRFRHRSGVFAPPWLFHQALRHGRPKVLAPFKAAWTRRADPGIVRMLQHEKRAPRQAVMPWPGAF